MTSSDLFAAREAVVGARSNPATKLGDGSLPCRHGSIRLSTGELYHLGPLLGFVGDQLSKVGGRARKCRAAQVGKPRFHLGIGEARIDLLVELFNDLGGCVLGRAAAHVLAS